MRDLDAIFKDLEPAGKRFESFCDYVGDLLPDTHPYRLVPDSGKGEYGDPLPGLDPSLEKELLKRAIDAAGDPVTLDLGGSTIYGVWMDAAGACIFMEGSPCDHDLLRSLFRLAGQGFEDHRKSREQERLIRTRKKQAAREKAILVTRDREILAQNFAQHEKYAKMLESEIEHQTRDLVAARKSAEAASKAKSEFLANMSHEIRTPMNGVIGMLEILSETHLTRDQQSYVESTRQSAHSLLTIINDILDFSKVEAGKLDIEQINFNLAHTLYSVLDAMAPRAREKGLELAMMVPEDVPLPLIGDPSRIRQVLVNLVSNAVKFTREGHVFIRVSCGEDRGRSCCLRFEVEDTGMGIPEDKIHHLFDLFSQVDSSTTRKFGGTGLGLAISRQLSHLMGGDIGVTSRFGKGSTFWFTFQARKEAGKVSRFPEIPPLKVLVAEGSAVHREVMDRYLGEFRCRPFVTADAPSTLAALESAEKASAPYDILLVDEGLPGMPGSRLCLEWLPRFKETTPVLVLPEHLPGIRDKYRSCTSYFLFKPVKKKDLFFCLKLASQAPARSGERPLVTSPGSGPAEKISSCPRARPLKILLAEDNAVNRQVATLMLKSAGHRILPAKDGQEALDIYRSDAPDLILMDIQMPVMDGETACKIIRELEAKSHTHTPIVALTANAMKGDQERYIASGMDAYLAKPIQKATLLDTVHRLIP